MGYEREVRNFHSGCDYQYFTHDFFNYSKDHQFFNVCGRHQFEIAAMEEQNNQQIEKEVITQAIDVLTRKIKVDNVIQHLRMKNLISKKEESRLLEITNDYSRASELLSSFVKSEKITLQQLKTALIKADQMDRLNI